MRGCGGGGGSIPYTLTTPSARCNPVNHPGSYSLLCARLSLGLQARTTNLLNIVRVGILALSGVIILK